MRTDKSALCTLVHYNAILSTDWQNMLLSRNCDTLSTTVQASIRVLRILQAVSAVLINKQLHQLAKVSTAENRKKNIKIDVIDSTTTILSISGTTPGPDRKSDGEGRRVVV